MPTLEQLRANAEAKLEKLLAKLDERHKKQLRDAIQQYGWNVPDSVWQSIQSDMENEEIAAAILLLMTSADEWTTDEISKQGVLAKGYSRREFMGYAFDAQRRTQELAAQTTNTLRSRIQRKVQDSQLTGPGEVGSVTEDGIDETLDDVFTDQRRQTISIDQTTSGFSRGQMNAAERADGLESQGGFGSDGAQIPAGMKTTIELIWRTELDNLVCPRCRPLEGTTEDVWGIVFPEGPGNQAHPNCRCYLEPRVVLASSTTESYRESEETDEHWITLDNGVHVKVGGDGVISDGPEGLKGTDLDADQAKGVEKKIAKAKAKKSAKSGASAKQGKPLDSKETGKYLAGRQGKLSQTDAEKKSLEKYVLGGYREINTALRDGKMPKEAKHLDAIIARQEPLDKAITVVRGLKSTEFLGAEIKPGLTVVDKGYMSTTPKAAAAAVYAKTALAGQKNGEGAVMNITVPEGAKGMYFRAHDEFTLPRNTKLKITDVKTVKGIRQISATVVLSK